MTIVEPFKYLNSDFQKVFIDTFIKLLIGILRMNWNSIPKFNHVFFLIIVLAVVFVAVSAVNSTFANASGTNLFPYFASPNSENAVNYMDIDSPFVITVAIPGDYTAGTTIVKQVQYEVYEGDASTPSYTILIQNPKGVSKPKRIDLQYDIENGNDWTLISSDVVTTSGALIYANPDDTDYSSILSFSTGLKKFFVTVTLTDTLTGQDQNVYTQTESKYWLED